MDNECTHEKKYDLAQDNFYLCKLCGLLIHKNVFKVNLFDRFTLINPKDMSILWK